MGAASKMKYGLGYRTSTATVTAVLPAPEAPSHPRPTWGKLWKWFWRIPWIPMAYQCVKVRNEMSQGLRVALPNDSVVLNSVVINLKTRYFNGGLLLNFWSVYLELGDGLWCIWWSIACDSLVSVLPGSRLRPNLLNAYLELPQGRFNETISK